MLSRIDQRTYTKADIGRSAIGDALSPATTSAVWRIAPRRHMLIFLAISIVSSTSMPRYRTVLSSLEGTSRAAPRLPVGYDGWDGLLAAAEGT
jgi:hypothetical protein